MDRPMPPTAGDSAAQVTHPEWCVEPLPHDLDDCAGEQRPVAATGQPVTGHLDDGVVYPAVVISLTTALRMAYAGIHLEVLPKETLDTVLRPEEARQLAEELVAMADVAEGGAR